MRLDDHITEHFTVGEMAYRRRGQLYLPDAIALAELRRTCELVLEPLRAEAGAPIYVLAGGGYDPLRDEDGVWISHRNSLTTKHHHGGAVDFRIGTNRAGGNWAHSWNMERAAHRVEELLAAHGIPGGVGRYPLKQGIGGRLGNDFVHVDPRSRRARWRG